MQTYTKTEAWKLYSGVFWIFLPNVIKIDPYNFELYRFKIGTFFETQCMWYSRVVAIMLNSMTEQSVLKRVNVWRVLSHRVFCRGGFCQTLRSPHCTQSVCWKRCLLWGFRCMGSFEPLMQKILSQGFCHRVFVSDFTVILFKTPSLLLTAHRMAMIAYTWLLRMDITKSSNCCCHRELTRLLGTQWVVLVKCILQLCQMCEVVTISVCGKFVNLHL